MFYLLEDYQSTIQWFIEQKPCRRIFFIPKEQQLDIIADIRKSRVYRVFDVLASDYLPLSAREIVCILTYYEPL